MKIINFEMYRDGGTIEIETDKGVFCFDDRIGSETKGKVYNGYPKDDNSNLIENTETLIKEIIEGLKVFKNDFYSSVIEGFINNFHR